MSAQIKTKVKREWVSRTIEKINNQTEAFGEKVVSIYGEFNHSTIFTSDSKGDRTMSGWIFRNEHEAFAERFRRSLGFWTRVIETGGIVFLSGGIILGMPQLWHDTERMIVPLLLAAIGLFTALCYLCLLGVMAELSYLSEKLLKETPVSE